MVNTALKRLYLKIQISKCYSRLSSIKELYLNGRSNECLGELKTLYADLDALPYKQSSLSTIYSGHSELLLRMKNTAENNFLQDLNNFFDEITEFLDEIYNTAFLQKPVSKRVRKSLFVGGAGVAVLLLIVLYSPLKARYEKEKNQYDVLVNENAYKAKTLSDIFDLKEALDNYHKEHNSYPKSSGGWDAIIAAFGESKKDWIPGLVPKYIKELPRDPRKSKDPMQQYMYKSDGQNFKLIAHFPLGITEVINLKPELVDSIRPSWAFGVWSKGAKGW